LLRIRNLSKSYGKNRVFEGVSFDLVPGQLLGLLGLNGSGKTTLSRLLLGLESPDSGGLLCVEDGKECELSPTQLRDSVYYVFQNPDDQIVGTIVEDDVAFGGENRAYPRQDLVERVRIALERTGLTGLEGMNPIMLSGGQKQRLAIAGALAVGARYLVLDEPTAMLDTTARKEVLELIMDLLSQGLGILLITHLPSEMLLCHRLLVLRDGEAGLFDDPRQFFLSGKFRDFDLEFPDELVLETGKSGSECRS
jgi:energy-coupling factor transport system ATP-binding protein